MFAVGSWGVPPTPVMRRRRRGKLALLERSLKSILGMPIIHGMDIRSFDLNLLRALDALLQTAGVSRAAERINLSQPAMSAALARLRASLKDPLLVRSGAAMRLTPAAESLRPRVRRIVEDIEAALTGHAFDPRTSERSFRLAASDVAAWSSLRSVISSLAACAPHVAIEIFPLTDNIADRLANGEAELA